MQNSALKLIPMLVASFILGLSCNHIGSNKQRVALKDFEESLVKGMPCDSVQSQFGRPLRIEGSGIDILFYPIEDNTEMMIGCAGTLIYARQVDSTGKTLLELIE